MVVFQIKYFDKIKYATIYDVWDITDKKHSIVKAKDVTSKDVGKFLKLNDGSKQYVKILNFYKGRIDTSSGVYYKSEIISMVNPRIPFTEYCGAKKGEESFAIVPATFEEKMVVRELFLGRKPDCKITKRVSIMNIDEMKRYFIEKGRNENSILEKLDELAFGKTNQHTINALKAMDTIFNMNVLNEKKVETKAKSLAELFGFGTNTPTMLEACERAEIIEQ